MGRDDNGTGDGCSQHLMCIKTERICFLRTLDEVSVLIGKHHCTTISRIHMQPHAITVSQVCQRLYIIVGAKYGGSCRCIDQTRNMAVLHILTDGIIQQIDVHSASAVRSYDPHIITTDTSESGILPGRIMRFF